MRRIPFSANFSPSPLASRATTRRGPPALRSRDGRPNHAFARVGSEGGFTILELMVAMFLCAIIGTLVAKVLVLYSDTYRSDMLRLRIQQNVRGALDIVAMNIRQAGEGLDQYFPAVTLVPGLSAGTSKLTLRRKTLSEVFTACQPIIANSHVIVVSDVTSAKPECLPVNLASSVKAWSDDRKANNNSLRVYLYDRVAKTGEFVDYTGENINIDGNNYLSVSGPNANYPVNSTSMYVLEEYSFSLNEPTNTLQLFVDGKDDEPQDVAYQVTKFTSDLLMDDGTTATGITPTDAKYTWKNIREINLTLEGEESWRGVTMNRLVRGAYFPRNVLSH